MNDSNNPNEIHVNKKQNGQVQGNRQAIIVVVVFLLLLIFLIIYEVYINAAK